MFGFYVGFGQFGFLFLGILCKRLWGICVQDPIKSLHFSNSNPVCHAFDSEAKDGHDLLIGLSSGDSKNFFAYSLRGFLKMRLFVTCLLCLLL